MSTAVPPGSQSSRTSVTSSPNMPPAEGRQATSKATSHEYIDLTKSTESTAPKKAASKRNILARLGAAIGRAVQEGFAKLLAWFKGLRKRSADISASKTPVPPAVKAGGIGTSRVSVTPKQIENAQAGFPTTKAALKQVEQPKSDAAAEPGREPLKIPNFKIGQQIDVKQFTRFESNEVAKKNLNPGDQIVVFCDRTLRYAIVDSLGENDAVNFKFSNDERTMIKLADKTQVFVLKEPSAKPMPQSAAAPIASTPRTTFSLGDKLTNDEFEQYQQVNNKALLQPGVDVVIRELRGPIYGKVLGENVHGFNNFVIKVGDRNIYADISHIYIKKSSVAQEANKPAQKDSSVSSAGSQAAAAPSVQMAAPSTELPPKPNQRAATPNAAPQASLVQQKPSDRVSPKLKSEVNANQVDTLTEDDIKNLKEGDIVIVERWDKNTDVRHYMYGQLAEIQGNVYRVRFKEDSRGHHFGQGVLRKLKDPSSPSAQKVEEPPVASARPQPAAKAPAAPKPVLPSSPPLFSSPRESFKLGDFLTKEEFELWKKNSDENAPLNIGDEVVVRVRGGMGSYDKILGYGVHKDGTPNKELILLEKNNLASKGVVYKKKAASAAAPAAEPSTAKPKGTGFKVGDEVIVEGLGFVKIRKIEGNKYYIRTDNDIVVNAYTAEQLKKPKG